MKPEHDGAPGAEWRFACKVHYSNAARGRRRLRQGEPPVSEPTLPGSVPRVARLLALAHRFRNLVSAGEVADYADLARLAGVTRPRMTQIMNLLHLAPDIQEAILDLPRTLRGRDPMGERDVRPIASVVDWSAQRRLWRELTARSALARSA